MESVELTDDQKFIKIRLELCNLLLGLDDVQKRNTYILQLTTLVKAIKMN